MSDRDNDREWLLQGSFRDPDGWEAFYIAEWGLEGALDLLACQGGRVWEVDLRHSLFRRDRELKLLVVAARTALSDLSREAYSYAFATLDERKARAASEEEEEGEEP